MSSNVKYPIIYFGPDMCPKCKNRTIEIFDYFNNPMGYSKLLDLWNKGKPITEIIDKRSIYKMRCRSCGTNYSIRYYGEIPLPDLFKLDEKNWAFMDKYKTMKD